MSRRVSNPPQTPLSNDDALERSMRRQRGSTRKRESLADVARRVNDSPLPAPDSSVSRRRFSGRASSDSGGQALASAPVLPGDFQEWMKMVRLKRVKANNAFTIQLIDCLHNMVQGASFQEATHTLGGCLTVYKNRIARVKDDTSKLLVGVTEKKSNDAGHSAGADDSDNDISDDEAARSRKRTARQRRQVPAGADAFLVPGEKLEIDTNELATTIDPLLRKMSADFDKRGAGALLQYSLKPDKNGRLLLDAEAAEGANRPSSTQLANASGDTCSRGLFSIAEEDEDLDDSERRTDEPFNSCDGSRHEVNPAPIPGFRDTQQFNYKRASSYADLAHFNVEYFANVDIAACEAIPNVNGIAAAVKNPDEGTDALVRSMRAWAANDPSDTSIYAGQHQDPGDGSDLGPSNFDQNRNQPEATGHAPEIGLEFRIEDGLDEYGDQDDFDDQGGLDNIMPSDAETSIASIRPPADGNWLDLGFLQRVDAQQSNWAGPSFWKIRRLRAKEDRAATNMPTSESSKATQASRKVAKAPAIIDFMQESDVDAEDLFQPGKSAIYLPARQYDESDKHLLPVDMRVTTTQLVNLSLRPNTGVAPAFMREAWSAGDTTGADMTRGNSTLRDHDESVGGASIADDGQDNGEFFFGGWDDVDAEPGNGEQRPQTASAMFSQTQPTQQFYGSQRHQLNYARVAKHVDVRKLKDNVWHAITHDAESADDRATTLLNVIHETQPQYNEQQRADLSPAMYFISLLHLSNERGMRLENTDGLTDIRIRPEGVR